nr:RelA/SpoT domain-containing protein [Agarivorans sp. B2Z047]
MIGRCCREIGVSVTPVKRLKRLETIVNKLQRKSLDGITDNQTCVTNMNDIGGCRAIFPDISSLRKVREKLTATIENEAKTKIKIKNVHDYIAEPKPNDCGYRSVHIIYRYEHSSGKAFNIEAQLRTKMQHIWATTVEIIDILERTNIKTHSHSPDNEKTSKQVKWEELLSIMSQYIASEERAVTLSPEELIYFASRLQDLNNDINALSRLRSFNMMSESVPNLDSKTTRHVLLVINESKLETMVIQELENHNQAISIYNEIENAISNVEGLNTLLVSTKNMAQLADAYPNYVGDCLSFIKLLEKAMQQPASC